MTIVTPTYGSTFAGDVLCQNGTDLTKVESSFVVPTVTDPAVFAGNPLVDTRLFIGAQDQNGYLFGGGVEIQRTPGGAETVHLYAQGSNLGYAWVDTGSHTINVGDTIDVSVGLGTGSNLKITFTDTTQGFSVVQALSTDAANGHFGGGGYALEGLVANTNPSYGWAGLDAPVHFGAATVLGNGGIPVTSGYDFQCNVSQTSTAGGLQAGDWTTHTGTVLSGLTITGTNLAPV